ncbi:MAG: hypothetical protein QGF53_07440 [Alphaproteobacteria bacterium]|jgi:hypothetical protein|nr:hypothetical protein [Alphaproteobacteria bacterium]
MKSLRFGTAVLAALAFCYTGSAMAANCSGHWTNVNQSTESIDLGDGHTLVVFSATGSVTSDNSPYNAIGMCGGYFLTTPAGETFVRYACTRKDANGDSYSDHGGMDPGDERGHWMQTGGTGVFAGKNNSGTWIGVLSDGGVDSGTFEGNCE